MNIVVFSKNRAPQLELFLRSMKRFFNEYHYFKINVLYLHTSEVFKKGYDKVISQYPEVNFVLEKSFKKDLVALMDDTHDYSIFFVDDIVWKNNFTVRCNEFTEFENDKNILTFSLRLHPNMNYCYAASTHMQPLSNNVWNWNGLRGDFGYPMSVDAHFFRTEEIIGLIKRLQYTNPNQFEAIMAAYPINKPKMICCEESIVFNNPCNKVQTNNPNKHGNISADYLNQEFLNDFIIDLEPFVGLNNQSCHQEMPVKLIKNN